MYKYFRSEVILQFIRFCVVGVANTIIDVAIYYALTRYFHIYFLVANAISFSLAVCNSYLLNKFWTFKDKSNITPKQFVKFFIVSVVGLALTEIILGLLVDMLGIYDLLAKAFAIGVVLIWNFVANKFLTFKK